MHRSLLVETPSKLSYNNGCIIAESELSKTTVPLAEIDTLVVDNNRSVITTALANNLAQSNVDTLICDNKHMPCAKISPICGSGNGFARVSQQLAWHEDVKNTAWRSVVTNKMNNQILIADNLVGVRLSLPLSTNVDNDEGILARMYFRRLFGRNFVRHLNDDVNAMLNYGYSLLLSQMTKIVLSHGYLTQLGLHHCAKTNNNNFVCDVMEPFRPFVDRIVFHHKCEPFDRQVKLSLLDVYNENATIFEKKYGLADAMSIYFESICDFLNQKTKTIAEVVPI